MNEPAASTPAQPAAPKCAGTAGDEFVHAFNQLRAELVSTLYFYLGSYADAQDAAQNAFLKGWRRRREVARVQNLRSWIFRIAMNAGKDLQRDAWRRRRRPLASVPLPIQDKGVSPVKSAVEREAREQLRAALLGLRPEEKEVFLLRQNAAMTYEEIARILRSPVGTVKTQMRSAIAKLRQVLREE